MQCGQLWAWWLKAQELDFQGAEGGECRDSACPLFLVSGKEKGGGWQEKDDRVSMETPTISIWPRSSHCVTDLFTKGDDTKHCEKTEHGIRYKLPRITHWLLKVTLKRHCFLVLSYWLFLLWVLLVTRILFSHWPLDNLIQVCAHLFQEQRPPAMCFSISLNSGSIISSSSCSLPFPSPSLSSPLSHNPAVRLYSIYSCLICCNSFLEQWGRQQKGAWLPQVFSLFLGLQK